MEPILFKLLNEIKTRHYPEQTYFLLLEINYIEQRGVFPGEGYFLPKYNILSENEEYTLTHNDEKFNREDLLQAKPLDIEPTISRKLDIIFEQFELQLNAEEIGLTLPDKPKKRKTYKKLHGRIFKRVTQYNSNSKKNISVIKLVKGISALDKARKEAEKREWQLVERTLTDEKTLRNFTEAYAFDIMECHQWKMKLEQQLINRCKEWNDQEYENISRTLKEWEGKTESTKRKKWIKYLSDTLGEFDDYYFRNKNKFETKIPFPNRKMKEIIIETTQALFDSGEIEYVDEHDETENDLIYAPRVIEELKKTYKVIPSNEGSIIKYFTDRRIIIKKHKDKITVVKNPH